MRIAYFLPSFPEVSQTFILRQITGQLERGHEVRIYAPRRTPGEIGNRMVRDAGLEGCVRYLFPSRSGAGITALFQSDVMAPRGSRLRRIPRALRHAYRSRATSTLRSVSSMARRVEALLAEPRPDLVHCHFGDTALDFGFAATLWDSPLVVSFYGYDCSSFPRQTRDDVYLPLFAQARCVTVLSHHMERRLLELGCDRTLLCIQPLGVDPSRFPFRLREAPGAGDPVRLLTVARLTPKKGLEFALRAFAEISDTHPRVRYDIIGDGELRPQLERLARSLGITQRVSFRGARSEGEVARAMAEAHLFLLPSVTGPDGDQEGTPTVLIEAASCGLPVLSTHHAGIPEIVVDGETGLLANEGSVEELANHLRTLLSDPHRWSQMGTAGRRYVEHRFDTRRLSDRLESIYRFVIEGGAGAPTEEWS